MYIHMPHSIYYCGALRSAAALGALAPQSRGVDYNNRVLGVAGGRKRAVAENTVDTRCQQQYRMRTNKSIN